MTPAPQTSRSIEKNEMSSKRNRATSLSVYDVIPADAGQAAAVIRIARAGVTLALDRRVKTTWTPPKPGSPPVSKDMLSFGQTVTDDKPINGAFMSTIC